VSARANRMAARKYPTLNKYYYAKKELWKRPLDPLLEKIAAVLTEDNPIWNGSATELAALLLEDMQPNILTRRLNVKAGELRNKYQIDYSIKRTRNGSAIYKAAIEIVGGEQYRER